MILYFSGTGNSLAISRHIAEKLNETVMPLSQAVHQDLSRERRKGTPVPPPEGDGGGYETVVFHATWKDCP
ncbi:MAG: hypothetical protein PUB29_07180 [Bacteroidales bacterium]|nr:hypothetical protein [Bacteroidales bacterium]